MNATERSFSVVQEFSFKEAVPTVRALMDNKGEPWFVAKDICDVLELQNHNMAVSKMGDFERDEVSIIDPIGRNQTTIIINLSGLYRLIFRSNKPQAEAFSRWVFTDVLPAIHKTGQYGIPLNMEVPEDPAEALDLWVFLGKHKTALQNRLKDVRELEKKAIARVKMSAKPYHIPLDKQIGLFQEVQP